MSETLDDQKKSARKVLKKILMGFGVLFLALIIFIIVMFVKSAGSMSKYDERGRPVIAAFLESQNPWNYNQAKNYLSTEFIEATPQESGEKLFDHFNKLGNLVSIDQISISGCRTYKTIKASLQRCEYIVSTSYQNSSATINIGLKFKGEETKVLQLSVNSNIFIN